MPEKGCRSTAAGGLTATQTSTETQPWDRKTITAAGSSTGELWSTWRVLTMRPANFGGLNCKTCCSEQQVLLRFTAKNTHQQSTSETSCIPTTFLIKRIPTLALGFMRVRLCFAFLSQFCLARGRKPERLLERDEPRLARSLSKRIRLTQRLNFAARRLNYFCGVPVGDRFHKAQQRDCPARQ